MARTTDEIKKSLITTLTEINPSIDVTKGPAYDILIQPFAPEAATLESAVERLAIIYSNIIAGVATDAEAAAFATTFGMVKGGGTNAIGYVHFYRFTRPRAGQVIDIPVGIILSNSDNTLSYQTTEDAAILGDYSDSYFNSTRNTYEVRVPVQAVTSGEAYDVPAYQITRLPTSLTELDGVENRAAISGGSDAETNEHLVNRTIKKFSGLDTGTSGGIESIVRDYDPSNVYDVSVVTPKNRTIFYRQLSTPAIDVYVIGETLFETEQINTALGGETEILLDNVPVSLVDTVQVNGQDVDFTFLPDTELASKQSARSVDKVLLASPLSAFDVVNINYSYNKLIADIQENLFLDGDRIFNTDILTRSAFGAYITFQANARIASSFDPISKLTEIETAAIEIIEQNAFVDEYIPNDIRDAIKSSVSGILELNITKFTLSFSGTTDIETITFKANEKPLLDEDTFDISVRQ